MALGELVLADVFPVDVTREVWGEVGETAVSGGDVDKAERGQGSEVAYPGG